MSTTIPLGVGVVAIGFMLIADARSPVSAEQGDRSEQAPIFRARTDVISFDVSVLDRERQPVRGLTANDFTVLENGVLRPVVAFAEVEVPTWSPGKAVWTREVEPDVASNRRDAQRAVVIVMDDFNTRWDPGHTKLAKSVAASTIDRLGPADLAAVVYTVNRRSGQEFTSDRVRLRAAVNRFIPSGLGPQPDTKMAASNPGRGLTMPSRSGGIGSGACMTDCVRMALQNAAEILQTWPGVRKTVVLISPGTYGLSPDALEVFAERGRTHEMFDAMQRANINIYQFDPRGLEVESRPSDDFGTFAEVTGGRAVTNTNAPADLVPQMFLENSSYYLLGLQPTDGGRDGRFRRIEVRVNRPDVEVRARSGYYPPSDRSAGSPERPASNIDRALSGGLPTGDWPLALTAAPFATRERPGAAVALVARANLDADLAASGEVDLVVAAFDERWREVGVARGRFRLAEQRDGLLDAAEMGLRLNLAPGRYEIRAAVTSPSTARTGSVYTSLTVPNFARDRLSLSGIVLGRNAGGAALPDDLAGVVPVRPTAERVFSNGDHAVAALRAYQGGRSRLESVRVNVRIVDADDRVVFTETVTLEPANFGNERQMDYRIELPLDRLAAGEHLLTIEATTNRTSARRDVRFSVRR